jgi:putative hydrolase of the HAD superfamily
MGGMGEWVLFDYGGVLCRDQSARDRRAIEAAVGVEDPDRFWAGYWSLRRPYDEGTLSPADYWSRVVGTDVGDRLDAIEAVDVASWSHPYEETLALARRLAARGARLALLSNCPEPMAVAIDGMSWTDLIPDRFYSCRLGLTKPDPAIYQKVLTALGARPQDVTFVDDRPPNVAAAAALGMRALLFTDPATLAADLDLQGDA